MPHCTLVPLGDVLTVTTGIMLSERKILGLRGLIAFQIGLSNDVFDTSITDSGCLLLKDRCKADLVRQHPWLADINCEEVTPSNAAEWLEQNIRKHGTHLAIEQMPR